MQLPEKNGFRSCCRCQKVLSGNGSADMDRTDTSHERLGKYHMVPLANGKVGFNIYSQFWYGRDKRHVDYPALEKGVRGVCETLKSMNAKTLALPKIGCGLAGGEWPVVKEILEKVSSETGVNITIYEFEPEPYV